jgi:hypothetical protein
MPTAGKFCTPSSPSEHHGSPLFTLLFSRLIQRFSPLSHAAELDKTVIRPIKQVAARSSIRGFKDDYYHVDTDVVLIEGEVHDGTKPVSIAPELRSRTCIHVNADYFSLLLKGGHALHGGSSTR